MSNRIRIYMTGVGGQGTLTATTLLARVAVAQGVEVVAGEIHGMAQRGGVVESTILLGGWKSPKLGFGEADIVLGFEPLETLRGLRYLKQGGVVFSSTDVIPPLSVSAGREVAPGLDAVEQAVRDRASSAWFLPCRSMGIELRFRPVRQQHPCSALLRFRPPAPSGSKRWRKAFVRSCPPSWLT